MPKLIFASAKLDGDLTASHFILTPERKELRHYEQQEEMPLEDTQERLISPEQAADTSEAADEPGDTGPSLAPAALVGGTHQKRNPRKG